jgi:hypothetical protein
MNQDRLLRLDFEHIQLEANPIPIQKPGNWQVILF